MKKVLILCTGNSARSQMAEAIINARRGDSWTAVSAGTQPAERVNPYALRALGEIGINTQGSRPKHIKAQGEIHHVIETLPMAAGRSHARQPRHTCTRR